MYVVCISILPVAGVHIALLWNFWNYTEQHSKWPSSSLFKRIRGNIKALSTIEIKHKLSWMLQGNLLGLEMLYEIKQPRLLPRLGCILTAQVFMLPKTCITKSYLKFSFSRLRRNLIVLSFKLWFAFWGVCM